MAKEFDGFDVGPIHFGPPEKNIEGRTTGVRVPFVFFLPNEEMEKELKLFFYDGTVRPDVGKLLECIKAFKEKYGIEDSHEAEG